MTTRICTRSTTSEIAPGRGFTLLSCNQLVSGQASQVARRFRTGQARPLPSDTTQHTAEALSELLPVVKLCGKHALLPRAGQRGIFHAAAGIQKMREAGGIQRIDYG